MSATVSLGGAISVTVIRAASCDLFTFMEISSSDYGESLFHPGFDSQIMRDRDHGHGEWVPASSPTKGSAPPTWLPPSIEFS
jgi:hypothetical protein